MSTSWTMIVRPKRTEFSRSLLSSRACWLTTDTLFFSAPAASVMCFCSQATACVEGSMM